MPKPEGWTIPNPELQWGHDFDVVEDGLVGGLAEATIGWLQWGHDFDVVEDKRREEDQDVENRLQWGHDFDVVEDVLWNGHIRIEVVASMGPRL